jgi:acyl dehydratase
METTTKYLEDFQVGDTFHIPAKTMTDAHFLFFAGMTGDNHPIHYDDDMPRPPALANASPMGCFSRH